MFQRLFEDKLNIFLKPDSYNLRDRSCFFVYSDHISLLCNNYNLCRLDFLHGKNLKGEFRMTEI